MLTKSGGLLVGAWKLPAAIRPLDSSASETSSYRGSQLQCSYRQEMHQQYSAPWGDWTVGSGSCMF